MEQDREEKKKLDKDVLKRYFNQKTFLMETVCGLLVLLVVYVFLYLPYLSKTDELEASNRTRSSELSILEAYYNNMSTYQADIVQMQSEIEDMLAEYPADTREEDILMLATKMQTENSIVYSTISMDETEGVYTIPLSTIAKANMEGMDTDLIFTKKRAVYVNDTDYENLKYCIQDILDANQRIAIDNIVYVKNESTGNLEGNIELLFYSLVGTGKEYVAPEMSDYASGTENIFQSVSEGQTKENKTIE